MGQEEVRTLQASGDVQEVLYGRLDGFTSRRAVRHLVSCPLRLGVRKVFVMLVTSLPAFRLLCCQGFHKASISEVCLVFGPTNEGTLRRLQPRWQARHGEA